MTCEKYFFSIIIPVYNTKNYLDNCIKSVIRQKFKNIQLILINDCSTDGSKKICEKYKKKFDLILINHKKRLGAAISRNDGLKLAKGEYIIFLDSDDYLLGKSLFELKNIIIKNKFPNVILNNIKRNRIPTSNDHILKNFKDKLQKKKEFFLTLNKNKIIFYECWLFVISKKLIIDNNISFQKIQFAEDATFVIKILLLMNSIIINKSKFLHHRSREKSLKHTVGIEAAYAYILILIDLYRLFKIHSKNNVIKRYLKFIIFKTIAFYGAYITLLNKNETSKLSQKTKEAFNKISTLKINDFLKKINIDPKSKNAFKIISDHQNFIEKKIVSSVKNVKFYFNTIYIYCADFVGRAAVNILKKNKFHIKNIYDDDLIFAGQKISNIPIRLLAKNKSKLKNLNKVLVIVCNFDKKIFKRILQKLVKKGFLKKQILQINY